MVNTFDNLPWIVRLLILIVFGWPVAAIYRIVKGLESKNNTVLLVGVITIFFPVLWIVDVITTILGQGISVLA